MKLGSRIAIISDVHGERSTLELVLQRCHNAAVESIVLLGDLFDRVEQAAPCAETLAEWPVTGVIGNHEREALAHLKESNGHHVQTARQLLDGLGERLVVDNAMFVHDEFGWKPNELGVAGVHETWLTFAGHTHFRAARDDNGPLDISTGQISLRSTRRYLINPGAVVEGQYAIWDRVTSRIMFERV